MSHTNYIPPARAIYPYTVSVDADAVRIQGFEEDMADALDALLSSWPDGLIDVLYWGAVYDAFAIPSHLLKPTRLIP